MGKIRFRLAKPCDAKQISDIHYAVRENYPVGIFAQMGKSFLRQYYKIILNDPYEVVICAENEKGEIVGFNSATLDAEAQMKNFRSHKIKLGLAAIGSIICNPSLIKPLFARYKSTQKNSKYHFVANKGTRGEYWSWKVSEKDPISCIEMNASFRAVLKALGIKELFFEVDKVNDKIVTFHKANKAEEVETIILPDGRERVLMKSDLTRKSTI